MAYIVSLTCSLCMYWICRTQWISNTVRNSSLSRSSTQVNTCTSAEWTNMRKRCVPIHKRYRRIIKTNKTLYTLASIRLCLLMRRFTLIQSMSFHYGACACFGARSWRHPATSCMLSMHFTNIYSLDLHTIFFFFIQWKKEKKKRMCNRLHINRCNMYFKLSHVFPVNA